MEVTCHCGNIKLKSIDTPKEVAKCNCSICRRYSALWAYFEPSEVEVLELKSKSNFYIWGDKEVEFHSCSICHCLTHYVTTEKCDSKIVAINMNMADLDIIASIPVRKINGDEY